MNGLWVLKYRTAPLLGLLLVLGAAASWAVGNLCLKLAQIRNGFRLLVWMAIVPPLPLLSLSALFATRQWAALRSLPPSVSARFSTGLIASLLCFGFWAYLVQHYSPNRVAPFSLLVPIFGLAFSVLLLGDSLSPLEIMGAVLVFGALCLTVLVPTPQGAIAPLPTAYQEHQ